MTRFLSVVALVASASFSGLASAGSEMPCERIEYAQLKDATRKELNDDYCNAVSKAKLNKDLGAISRQLLDRQASLGVDTSATSTDIRAKGDAEVSCIGVAESLSNMLAKKFKAKPPASCK